jgi:hypothetical protein
VRSKKAKPRKTQRAQVIKLPPESVAARDEGPRLIPLGESSGDSVTLPTNRYVALADRALKLWSKSNE